ncbi:MAG: hypothetical protein JNM17_01235 [Archangium sp.]|nr:hypothetical protein [Archangium sp.]
MRLLILLLLSSMLAMSCGPRCTVANCSGCCDQTTDTCRAGSEATACGKGGTLCVACPSNQLCSTTTQTCVQRPAQTTMCGAANCDGCCDDVGNCLNGQSTASCGSGGATCTVCAMGQSCAPLTMGGAFGGRCM